MTTENLKKICFSARELEDKFRSIEQAVEDSEANFRQEGSNRVREDLRIMRAIFSARAVVSDIHEQLAPWANAFGFHPDNPEQVRLSWSLTVGKAVGISQGVASRVGAWLAVTWKDWFQCAKHYQGPHRRA